MASSLQAAALATPYYEPLPEASGVGTLALDRTAEYKPKIPTSVFEISQTRFVYLLLQPLALLALFALCVYAGHWLFWIPAAICGVLVFQRSFTNCHNVVHGSYPLPKTGRKVSRETLMTLYGLMFYYCGHLFKATHYAHHRKENRCGLTENPDPETVAHLPGWFVLVFGPFHTVRVFAYGFTHSKSRLDRVLGLCEAGFVLVSLGFVASWMWRLCMGDPNLGFTQKVLALYGTEAALLLWMFPFSAAWVPHRMCRPTMLGQARNTPGMRANPLAGLVAKVLFAGTRLHLVHHAWPSVPSCNADKVAALPEVNGWMLSQDDEHHHHH